MKALLALALCVAVFPARAADMAAEVVDAYLQALAKGDAAGVAAQLAPDLVLYEQGFEQGRDSYLRTQLPEDLKFGQVMQRKLVDRQIWEEGPVAWVLLRSVDRADLDGKPLELENAETLVLRRLSDGWKIVHIHRSAHRRAAAAAPPR